MLGFAMITAFVDTNKEIYVELIVGRMVALNCHSMHTDGKY